MLTTPAAGPIITFSRVDHWIIDTPIANPMSIYDAYKDSRVSWGINALGGVIVEVELEDGRTGVGISTGGEPACFIIERHLKRFLVGQTRSPMSKSDLGSNVARDLALRAQGTGDSCHQRRRLWRSGTCWASCAASLSMRCWAGRPKTSCRCTRPRFVRTLAQELGFHGAKLPLMYGPAEGIEGLKKNVALDGKIARERRSAIFASCSIVICR